MVTLLEQNPPSVLFQISIEKDERGKAVSKRPVPWFFVKRAWFELSPGLAWRRSENAKPLSEVLDIFSKIESRQENLLTQEVAKFFITPAIINSSGLTTIDLDPPPHQKDLVRELAIEIIRSGFAAELTPSGGCHIFCECDINLQKNQSGVLILGEDKIPADVFYTTHLTAIYGGGVPGGLKTLVEAPFLPIPVAKTLLEKFVAVGRTGAAEGTSIELPNVKSGEKIPQSRRWLTLQKYAARLAGAPPDVIAKLLHAINRTLCEPPLDDESVAEQARWAASIPSIEECETKLSIGSWWFGSKLTRAQQLQKRLRLPADVAMALINLVS